jgi:TolA-binding protein
MKDDLDDLSARARRDLLSQAELRELEHRLEGSHEASLAHRAGLEFDAEDLVLAGDEALVARINRRLLTGYRAQRRSHFRTLGLVLGGVCTTVAAAAAGPGLVEGIEALWLRSVGYQAPLHATPAQTRPSLPSRTSGERATLPRDQSAAPPPPPLLSLPPVESAAFVAEPEPSARPAAPPRPRGVRALPEREAEPVADTSRSLFAQASLARRQGDLPRATALYAELSRRFPGTAEADSAEIALGTLSLQSGAAGQALGHFEGYLSARPGGQLAADALWGKARALAALGREDEARRDLQLLIDRYPRSTYATAARAKLGQPP